MATCLGCSNGDVYIDDIYAEIDPVTLPPDVWCSAPNPVLSTVTFMCPSCERPANREVYHALMQFAFRSDAELPLTLREYLAVGADEAVATDPNCRCNFCSGQR